MGQAVCSGTNRVRHLQQLSAGRSRAWRTGVVWALLSVLLCAIGPGCTSASPIPPSSPSSTTSPAAQAPSQSPVPTLTPTSMPDGASETITLWVTELVSPLDGSAQADVLARQIAAFEATHPGLTVQVLHKKAEGKGGVLDAMITASRVAPAVLPDLAVIDTQLLSELAHLGLAVPLDNLVSPEVQQDLYPFAIQAGTVDEQLVGLQFEVESVQHAIYNPSKIAVAPLTWTEVFSSGTTYIFPAAGQQGIVNDAFLVQYLSTGARLVDATGAPALDPEAVVDVLSFYAQGIERGAVLTDVLSYSTVENCWPKYLQAEVVMSNISSNLYLALKGGEPCAIPTRDGVAIALTRGSAWVLTTQDASRQTRVTQLLEWLVSPANIAAWNQAAGRLPSRRAAFEQMPRDAYVTFYYRQLEYATPYADSPTHQQIYRAMQDAINAVLIEGIMPEAAVQDLLKDIDQETSP